MANPFNDADFMAPEHQIDALKLELSSALTMIRTLRNSAGDLLDDLNDLIGEVEADARLTEAMIPDDYRSLVNKMEQVSIDWNISGDLLNVRPVDREWVFVGPGGDQIEVTANSYDGACAELVSKLGYGLNEAEDGEDVCECGEALDLDGYDGKCGNCADAAEGDDDEADDRDIVAETGEYRANW